MQMYSINRGHVDLLHVYSSLDAGESSDSSDDDDADVVRGKKFKAVTCTGRQPGSSVFVFGPTLHINDLGDLIPRESQEYIWVPRILHQLHRVVNPLAVLPDPVSDNPLQYVIRGLQSIAGDNVISGVFLLGGYTSTTILVIQHCNTTFLKLEKTCSRTASTALLAD